MTHWKLRRHEYFPGVKGPVVACIMDGVGCGAHDEGDAVWLARTPHLDALAELSTSTRLFAHGTAVGLPTDADMGNSEVGHNAMGAGCIFDQGAKLIDKALDDGSLFRGEVWREAVARVKQSGESLHFIGLLSDGNVHSHIDQLIAMLEEARREGVPRVRVHALLDGRDVGETSALQYVEQLERVLEQLGNDDGFDYRIASGGGRMTTTMDRYGADWSVVERGWKAHVRGEARAFGSTREAVETFRRQEPGIIDQNLPSFVIVDDAGRPVGPIRDGASVILFNFRGDRAIELSRAFDDEEFSEFDRGPRPDVLFAGMMQYDGDLGLPERYLVSPPVIERTLGEYLAHNRIVQLAVSETQKFGHVTYFWNGNRSGMFDPEYETYLEVASDRRPFQERPWMKCAEITDALIDRLRQGDVRHARLNYPNGDMVGHTGHREASILAVEAIDLQIGRLMHAVAALSGALVVTADHGNADEMYMRDPKTGELLRGPEGRYQAKTSHTLNPVPFHVYAPSVDLRLDRAVDKPRLSNLAATLLHLLGYHAPEGYDVSMLA